jgi:CheY-like chemotaxis protein
MRGREHSIALELEMERHMAAATILIVDDDVAIRELLSETLAGEGYRVATAANGAEALQRLGQVQPSLIVLDVTMPVLDGLGVAQELRRRGSPIPILLVSALDDVAEQAHRLGAIGYLEKPFDLVTLLSTVGCYCTPCQR